VEQYSLSRTSCLGLVHAIVLFWRADLQRFLNHSSLAADEDLDVLRSGAALPGGFHVFGNQVLFLRANRPVAVPIAGWAREFLDSRGSQQLNTDLRSTLPALHHRRQQLEAIIHSRCPAIMDSILDIRCNGSGMAGSSGSSIR
jgi:hypothetical protein